MTNATTNANDSNASTRIRPKYVHLGIDGDDAAHVYRTTDETVHVIDRGGRRVHVEDLVAADASVDDWMAHAADIAGWQSQNYYRSLGELAADNYVGDA